MKIGFAAAAALAAPGSDPGPDEQAVEPIRLAHAHDGDRRRQRSEQPADRMSRSTHEQDRDIPHRCHPRNQPSEIGASELLELVPTRGSEPRVEQGDYNQRGGAERDRAGRRHRATASAGRSSSVGTTTQWHRRARRRLRANPESVPALAPMP